MAAIDFPNSPSNGQIFGSGGKSWKYNSTKGIWQSVASTTTKNLAALDESIVPSANVTYDLGTADNAFRDLYLSGSSINLGGATITATGSTVTLPAGSSVGGTEIGTGGGTTVYATLDQLPRSGVDTGTTAFVTSTSRFYIYNGTGWFNVAVVNQAPTITSAPSSVYNLYADGTPTILTLAATDDDGDELTWSYSAPDASGKATITQSNNVFTITPLTNISDTSFNIDFEVTDGINISTDSSTINIDNRSPTIDTGPSATYVLATDGSDTVITLAATDPDGESITWSYANSALTNQATISQSGNEFTITPNTTPAAYSDFTMTFTASDSIESTSTDATTFSLTFALLADEWSDTVLSIGTNSTNSLGNSTFIDRSTNAHTALSAGNVTQTAFHPYLDNWSVEFDGTGDYLTVPSSSDFTYGTGDFTWEFWIYMDHSTTNEYVLDHGSNGGTIAISGTKIRYYTSTTGTSSTLYSTGGTLTLNSWHHVAVSRSSGFTRLFIDGVLGSSAGDLHNYPQAGVTIGDYGSLGYELQGKLSNLRLIKGTALYTSNFTPPTEKLTAVSGTSLLTCQSNRFIDNSTSGHTITDNGNPKILVTNPFGQGSEYAVGENKGSSYFDGSSYIQVNTSSDWSPGTGDFCYEGWFKFANDNVDVGLFSAQNLSAGTVDFRRISDGSLRIGRYNQAWDSYTSGVTLSDTWHHIAFVRNSGTVAIYVDGVNRIQTGASNSQNYGIGGSNLSIGNNNTVNEFSGYMSDIRITKGAPVYTSNFTPPTSPVGNTNASLYLPFDNSGIFDKTGNHTLTLVGDASTSTTQTKFADTAMYFDGTGDYIEVPWYDALGSNDFTIESWIYIVSSADSYGRIIESGAYNTNDTWRITYNNTASTLIFQIGHTSTRPEIATTTALQGAWHHIAVCRDGNTIRFFVDGTQEGGDLSYSGSLIAPTNTNSILLGTGVTSSSSTTRVNYHNGYIENFQIFQRCC
jgi:hypothetical protein